MSQYEIHFGKLSPQLTRAHRLLFVAGKFLIGAYIGRTGISSVFGAAASLVVVLLWVYYSAQIFLFGAEFTWVYSHKYGSRKGMPLPHAPAGGAG